MKEVPYHIGIIPDGNRRWAEEKGLPSLEGHRRGLETAKRIGEYAFKKDVKVLTIWCFSTENWNRTKKEISYLMQLFSRFLNKKNIEEYNKKGIKIQVIGQKERLSKSLRERIKKAEELSRNSQKGILNLAISYGGRTEIIEVVKSIIKKGIPDSEITEEIIDQHLWTKDLPYPDLIIRTGGNKRLSGYFTWQSAYSELYFLDKYWPDFNEQDLDKVLDYYSRCQRNFGK